MQPEAVGSSGPQAYFDTPERAERLQLVAHLIRNADAVPYVRGPKGAGKTCFAERLASMFRQEATLVELDGLANPEVPTAVHHALGVSGEWPAAALDAVLDGDLVVMVDNADRLGAVGMDDLRQLRLAGGRIVLLGAGNPADLPGHWNIQLVDLPPFSEYQSREFLRFISPGGEPPLTHNQLTRLHRLAKGQPGPLIDAVHGQASGGHGHRAPWKWVLGGCAALLAALVLWQQDAINALFRPQPVTTASSVQQPPESGAEVREAGKPIAIPPQTDTTVPASTEAVDEPGVVETEASEQEAPETAAKPEPKSQPVAPAALAKMPATAPTEAEASQPRPAGEGVASAPESPVAPGTSHEEPVASSAPAANEQPSTPPEKPSSRVPTPADETDDLAWLRSRNGDRYTLQLAGSRTREPLLQVERSHQLPGRFAVFTRNLGGKPWHSLVYGDFEDRKAATQALKRLPADLQAKDAWPRSFSSIWAQLPAAAPNR